MWYHTQITKRDINFEISRTSGATVISVVIRRVAKLPDKYLLLFFMDYIMEIFILSQ